MPTSMETRSAGRCCQAALIDINLRWLHQALALLAKIDENVYATAPPALSSYRVGAHLRHILDFYQCFFKGLEGGRIDYDVRGRNRVVELSRSAACIAIHAIIHCFEHCHSLRADSSVLVRPEDADSGGLENSFMHSSISRELQALSSHTIHHFALIAVTLRLHGIAVDPEFGMAPSTLRFLASKSNASEEAA